MIETNIYNQGQFKPAVKLNCRKDVKLPWHFDWE